MKIKVMIVVIMTEEIVILLPELSRLGKIILVIFLLNVIVITGTLEIFSTTYKLII